MFLDVIGSWLLKMEMVICPENVGDQLRT